MKAMREWGYDEYVIRQPVDMLVRASRYSDLRLFDVFVHGDEIRFFAPVIDRHKIHQALPAAQYVKTTGILGFLLRQFTKPRRIIGIVTSVLIILLANRMVFAVTIRGSSRVLDDRIRQYLSQQGIDIPMYRLSLEEFHQLEQDLKETFFDDIEWINLRRIGSAYFIDYVERIHKYPKPKGMEPLIAYQSGIIARFELKRGVKVVKEFDFVKPGDILVTSEIVATDNEIHHTYVEGKVYAYTQHIVTASMKPNGLSKLHPAFGFFQMLFDCRRQIAQKLQEDESIVNENILLFENKAGRINMKIHYTLLEDITHP